MTGAFFPGGSVLLQIVLRTGVIYLLVLPMPAIQHAPSDRVCRVRW